MRKLCLDCNSVTRTKRQLPGHFWKEALLWILFFPVGILYSLWRLNHAWDGCKECGSARMIPLESPAARTILGE
jgi:hypothetical protein